MSFRCQPRHPKITKRIEFDGATIRRQRDEYHLTLEQTAEYLGLEPHQLAGIEAGTRTLSRRQALLLDERLRERARQEAAAARIPKPIEGGQDAKEGTQSEGSRESDSEGNEGASEISVEAGQGIGSPDRAGSSGESDGPKVAAGLDG